jgi:outer membrane protein TolC
MRPRILLVRTSVLLIPGIVLGCASAPDTQRDARTRVERNVAERLAVAAEDLALAEEQVGVSATVHELLQAPLTEESAIRIALLNHRGLRATLHGLGVPAAELAQAGLLGNPILAGNAKFFDGGTEVELGFSQSFLDVFYRPLRRHVAAAELAAAEACVAGQVIGSVFEVRRAFLDLRTARALAEIQAAFLDAEDAALVLMSELHRAGNVTDPMLTAAQTAYARARADHAIAESAAQEMREPLQVLLGLWGKETAWTIDESLDPLHADPREGMDLDRIESMAIAASMDLAETRARTEAAAQRAGLTSWETLIPAADLGLVAKRESFDGEWGFGPALAIGLPILDPGRARTAAAEATLRKALDDHYQAAVEVRSAARTFRERLIAADDVAGYLRDVYLPLRHRLVLETLQNFNGMQIGVFEVLLVKQQEIAARRELLETARAAWRARLDMEELLAGRLNHQRIADRPTVSAHSSNTATPGGHGS